METGTRPWGVLKTKPRCKECNEQLVGETVGSLNVCPDNNFDGPNDFVTAWFCGTCTAQLSYVQCERVFSYWQNDGIRQKPGRKPKNTNIDADSAA